MKTKMNNKVKALLMACCAVLLVFASVIGTLAYLTDTKTVTNTFTVGNVQIKLDEAQVNPETGKKISSEVRISGPQATNSYKILPGRTIDKDPTVTVLSGSEECYVRAIVTLTVSGGSGKAQTNMNALIDSAKTTSDAHFTWTLKSENTAQVVYEVRYNTAVSQNGNDQPFVLFETIDIPSGWNNADLTALQGLKIEIEAHAIQAESFANADAAWAAFDAQP